MQISMPPVMAPDENERDTWRINRGEKFDRKLKQANYHWNVDRIWTLT